MRKRQLIVGAAAVVLAGIYRGQGMAEANEKVDVAALATLRPGMPMEKVAKLCSTCPR
ncbi:hypothetical protein RHEC894_CH01970 [Rhizobium sp. CIAT894]|nr:hypothetical protein RHEC894_CH01970 [Rhizobium sp. CIAT894]